MSRLETDILSVLDYENYVSPKEIRNRLRVQCGYRTWWIFIAPIVQRLWHLQKQEWVESIELKPHIRGYRKARNGKQIPSQSRFHEEAANQTT